MLFISPVSATTEFRSCVTLVAGGSCSTADAQLLSNFYDVMTSFAGCRISQDNDFFSKYSQPKLCGGAASTHCSSVICGAIYACVVLTLVLLGLM